MKKPQLMREQLQHHESKLCSLLGQPWLARKLFGSVRNDIETLVEAIHRYKEYLQQRASAVEAVHNRSEPQQCIESNISMHLLPVSSGCINEYKDVDEVLGSKPEYFPVCLNKFAPSDRYTRSHWLDKLGLPYKVMLMQYPYGNNLGTLSFIWKVPQQADETQNARVMLQASQDVQKYSTREMRREFINNYQRFVSPSKSILRHMYQALTDDASSAPTAQQRAVDERVAKALLEIEAPEIIFDLRKLNGNPKATHFDDFWAELSTFLEEINPAVDDRRHGETLHMPIAVSVRHLREVLVERLAQRFPNDDKPVPSDEWIRLQFWPKNPFGHSALRHTGRFNVKFAVQIRQLRKDHPDAKYCRVILKYARHFACLHRAVTTYMSVDDKAIVPVGEPNLPIAASSRSHNRSLVLSSAQLKALDHDFHIHGIVPSVSFAVNIPESAEDSFYSGKPYVTLKDKVIQPSSALRHAAEQYKILSTDFPDSHVLLLVSDGGPDHRLTYSSVQVCLLSVFVHLDLDMLVAVRTCPYQSWNNIAERVMSTLNLGLQNVALCRKAMPVEFEKAVANKNTLADIRETIKKTPHLEAQLLDSMAQPIVHLSQRFMAMKIKEDRVKLSEPAQDEEISANFEKIHVIDPDISANRLRKEDLKHNTALHEFMRKHCRLSPYVFQVKKCLDPSCSYCKEHPIQVTSEQFSSLHYLPLPLLDASKTSYLPFETSYGKEPSDNDRPSSTPSSNAEAAQADNMHKPLLKNTKVRKVIFCGECFKPRCVYSAARLSTAEEAVTEAIINSKVYTCGSTLFPPNSPLHDTVIVRQNCCCADPVEAAYYSSALVKFPPVCFYCGIGGEESLVSEQVAELRRQYGVVRPLCFLCQSEGKTHKVSHPNVTKKPRLQ